MQSYSPPHFAQTNKIGQTEAEQSPLMAIKERKKRISRFRLVGNSLCATSVGITVWGSLLQLEALPLTLMILAASTSVTYGLKLFSQARANERLIRHIVSEKSFPSAGSPPAPPQRDISPSFYALRKLREEAPIKTQLRRNLFLG